MRVLFAAAVLAATPAAAQEMSHDHHMPDHAGHAETPQPKPTPKPTPAPAPPAADAHAGHDMPAGSGMDAPQLGALGPYALGREASGTSWQPDVSSHDGLHAMAGPWMLMGHATLNGVYDWQGGRRGDEMSFVSGMIMGSARRDLGSSSTLQLRAMLSPDPFMGKRGYPLLLAAGETADGVAPLVDRQHPHDLFMELSASVSWRLSERDSVFVYAGLPGEPAFGPPAFMHRASIMDSPEAPISHHWLDSTHITFGVLTAGYVHGDWKLEGSAFKGREPDQHRYNIESPKLDSYAARLSWNPTANWSLQGSWARMKSPEQLEPDEDQTRWSASAIYTVPIGAEGWWSTTAAWGRRTAEHDDLDALVLESAVKFSRAWTVFGRAERTETNELTSAGGHHGPVYRVGKISVGAVRDFVVAPHVSIGLGGLYALNFVPGALKPLYGGEREGAMAFVRLKLH